jgi:hypothetical protein
MTERQITLAEVIAYHVAEAENYTAKASNWAQSAEDLKAVSGDTNGVRIEKFDACAQLAADIAGQHAAMADLLEELRPAP